MKAIVKQVMKNNDSPNQLLQGIMQEIRWKRDQIVNEGVVSDEIIENSIKINSMQSACTSMSNLNVSQLGMSMGR
ncbi:hypothetical protein [Wolbachia endosymbiont of Chironomus riparius]|uniref:hypothetical protein n=1 Tax=Wolbachia endosymbiont of Chironomus riparius TaxID=2883238 RepID=UPI00209CEB62|nr:hypothetical protein [Wolbachia endosymbiont of Chironomus riparius]